MRKPILTFVFALSIAAGASAGTYGLGNGGHVLKCRPAPTGSIFHRGMTLLDLYEGSAFYGQTYRGLASLRGLPLETAFARALKTYFRDEPFRMQRGKFAVWFARFEKEALFKNRLSPQGGTFLSPIPHQCRLHQGVVQTLPRLVAIESPGKLEIAMPVWRSFSTDLKVAILMHEYVYRHLALSNPGCGHSHVRRVTGILLADEDPHQSKGSLIDSLASANCRF